MSYMPSNLAISLLWSIFLRFACDQMNKWKAWELETSSMEYQFTNGRWFLLETLWSHPQWADGSRFLLFFSSKFNGLMGLHFVSSRPSKIQVKSSNILREAPLWLLNQAWNHMDCKLEDTTCGLRPTNGLYSFYFKLCSKLFLACELFLGQFFFY